MKKSIVLIALATLILGFNSCEKNEKTYQETYTFHFNGTRNGDDLIAVAEGYLKAVGVAADSEDESVLVNGEDSVDCATKFLNFMTEAEATLSTQTHWVELVYVVAYDSKHTLVYQKQWGKDVDRITDASGSEWDPLRAYPLEKITGEYSQPQSGKYIKNYYVDAFKSSRGYKALGKDVWISMDMNEWAGGRYIYISAEPTDDIEEAITGAFVLKSDIRDMPKTITYKGVEYTCCSELDGDPLPNYRNRDLNEGAHGKYLFLYTTHDKSLKRALVWGSYSCFYDTVGFGSGSKQIFVSSLIENKKIDIVGDEVEFIPGTTLVKSVDDLSNLQLQYRDVSYNKGLGQDMNEGAGGIYLYFVQQWQKR